MTKGSPVLWIVLYVLSVLLANLTLNHFIPLPLYGQLSIGTIFFAAVFTLRDRIHRHGLKYVFIAIALAVIVNVAAALYTHTPTRFILASFLGILAGELADTAVYQRFLQRSWWTRVLASNAVSVPIDTAVFTLIAFWGDPQYGPLIPQIIFADVIVKYGIAALFALRAHRTTAAPA
ncbi:VUT family protein [Deinococcus maricopensis]|uniref:Queuosine precursor transporter n=1 Tax=Deinococcus maricopensis (strain DSM 21211 / LMG 22137 / NRRL B-23946 / LB-34) TaxID=709986 RepID=E8U5U4_DEIML|nr:VUT family protein [Deinococcus maricopensis]ADV66433.1 protein of unknown function DUF165 [Deinococcus maricopensis DSM 21211]